MSFLMTNRLVRQVRSAARQLGLTKLAAKALHRGGYEERFSEAMLEAIQPGDVVWDVGANHGHYSALFSDIVGKEGHVVAFEPAPSTFSRLQAAVGDRANVTLMNAGLSDVTEQARIAIGSDELAATSQIMDGNEGIEDSSVDAARVEIIHLLAGESIIAQGDAPAPTILKIDVEGHEWKALSGMGEALRNPALRHVLIEVHFGIMDAASRGDDADKIVKKLEEARFEVRWTDPSHIDAVRRPDEDHRE